MKNLAKRVVEGSIATKLSGRFVQAVAEAARLHARQKRKGTERPYIGHLLGVASLVLENGGDEDQVIAALLHDAVEDQGGLPTLERIRRQFGNRVAEIVDGCTDAYTIPKPPWRERKEKYLAHLAAAGPSVRLVSAADKLHNVHSLVHDYRRHGESLWQRFSGGRAGTLWYYRAIADTLAGSACTHLIAELERMVAELEQLAGGHAGTPR